MEMETEVGNRKMEIGNWKRKLENGNWRLENGNRKREVAWHLSATVGFNKNAILLTQKQGIPV